MQKSEKGFRFEQTPESESLVVRILADTAKTVSTENVRCTVLESILETLGFEGYKVRKKLSFRVKTK